MKWLKKGLLFQTSRNYGWMKSHAQVPTLLIKEDRLRVYFSSRPKKNISLTTFADIDIDDFSKILYLHPKPILKLGSPGTFDEHGIMPSSIVENDGLVYLYYSGWSRGRSLPYSNYTGLAISEDGGNTFKKFSHGPIIDRTPFELYSATSPCVYLENDYWHMWYCSGTKWLKINGKLEHTYDIKYAHSTDGIKWLQKNKTIINPKNEYEAITKPSIIKLDNKYHMWYCYRGSKDFRNGSDGYRIGYAYSEDLQNWTRDDKSVGIKVSDAGWDSKMIAYPAVAKVKDEIIMIYNGNNFGAEGFGYAVLDTFSNCYER